MTDFYDEYDEYDEYDFEQEVYERFIDTVDAIGEEAAVMVLMKYLSSDELEVLTRGLKYKYDLRNNNGTLLDIVKLIKDETDVADDFASFLGTEREIEVMHHMPSPN